MSHTKTQTKISTAVKVAIITLAIGGIAAAAASIKIGQPKCPEISNKQVTVTANMPEGIDGKITITSTVVTEAEGKNMTDESRCTDISPSKKACEFQYNALVTVTVKTKDKFKVANFSGNCRNFTMNDATRTYKCEVTSVPGSALLNVTAVMESTEAKITVKENGTDKGATSDGSKFNCYFPSNNCEASFDKNTNLSLRATPSTGYLFKGWSGCSKTADNICDLSSLQSDKTLTVDFVKKATCGALKPNYVERDSAGTLINECFNFKNDNENCGSYKNDCTKSSRVCNNSKCVCPVGKTACSLMGGCVDLKNDTQNCGTCGTKCGTDEVCTLGNCRCKSGMKWCATSKSCIKSTEVCCLATQTNCNNKCVNTKTDKDNCGKCGESCGTGKTCTNGTCVCNVGTTLCSEKCVNLKTDGANCGSCGTPCNGGSTCNFGKCVCPAGKKACGSGSDLRCVGLLQRC